MKKLILNSYAKVNLYLEVLNKRKDSYHNIKTLFERIDLADKIILKTQPGKFIRIICDSQDVPQDNSNLAYRAAQLLQDTFKIRQGVEINIHKHIPVGSGLGGGSSNAACVLSGLNKIWGLNLSFSKLIELAKKLGSDVPFFIYDCSFAQGEGRGDRISPLEIREEVRLWHVLVVPKISVLTSQIYQAWDRFSQLTRPKYDVKIFILGLNKNDFSLISKTLFNSLEPVTFRLYPELMALKKKLKKLGLKSILMSGSGPAIFGVFSSRKEAVNFSELLKKNNSLQLFVTRTQ